MDSRSYSHGPVRPPGIPGMMPPGMPGMMPPGLGRHQVIPMQGHRLPHGLGPVPPQMPGQPVFVEDHMDHLAGKLDMLENELRYAWRALDVLSQEYIKMWERLEKMEGLLTEQQTVITQLIDLYTADSSDNADNSFDTDGGSGKFPGFGGKDPDESFYKALNVVHRDSYPQTVDNSLPMNNFNTAKLDSATEKIKTKKSKKGTESPSQYVNSGRNTADIDMIMVAAPPQTKSEANQGQVREDSDAEIRSMSSSMRSTQSGFSEISEFPVPQDNSPTYENLIPTSGNTVAHGAPTPIKRKLPQLPQPAPDNRRTRKDGYIGDPDSEQKSSKSQKKPVHQPSDIPSQLQPGSKKTKLKDINNDQKISSKGRVQSGEDKTLHMSTILEQDLQYDTYPKRKSKKRDGKTDSSSQDSPLTIIDGTYSFSLSDDNVRDQTHFFNDDEEQTVMENLAKHETRKSEETLSKSSLIPSQDQKTKSRPALPDSHVKVKALGSKIVGKSGLELAGTILNSDVNSPSESSGGRANSLFQQIQAREPDPSSVNKTRKLSLKEKRKLRTEQRELGSEIIQKSMEAEQSTPQQAIPLRKPDSSESDVSMRSDHSISPKRESGETECLDKAGYSSNGILMGEQQGSANGTRPRSNGINILPVQQQILSSGKSSSREFAVSRALGKYRQKQKKEREHFQGSSNSDSQEELDLPTEACFETGLDGTIRNIDAKLADIEEQVTPESSIRESMEGAPVSVHKQAAELEATGLNPFDLQGRGNTLGRSRRQSTEESIDSEDEWYQHEIMRLQKMEYEQEIQKIVPSDSVGERMTSVLGQLHDTIPEVKEDKDARERERKKREEELIPKKEPPSVPPDIPVKGEKEKKTSSRRFSSSDIDEDDDSSVTGGADEDSETQSGADTVDEEEDLPSSVPDVNKRPANLVINPSVQATNLSDKQPKPDLLEEVTAAAAEAAAIDAYPEYLKNGYYGEDGLWYDEHGETGYYDEDGQWYDYIDEVGYHAADGEWVEYDYGKGYFGEDGNWHENEEDKPQPNTQEDETDHFLWVSEERINGKYSNDQILSSELNKPMVIGRLSSGSNEDESQELELENLKETPASSRPISDVTEEWRSRRESGVEYQSDREFENAGSIYSSNNPMLSEEEGPSPTHTIIEEEGTPTTPSQPKAGKRWGALVKERKADIIELVRI